MTGGQTLVATLLLTGMLVLVAVSVWVDRRAQLERAHDAQLRRELSELKHPSAMRRPEFCPVCRETMGRCLCD